MKFAFAAILVGGGAVIALVAWFGVQSIGGEMLDAGWVIPLTSALLAFQLFLSAAAWRIVMGVERPRLGRYVRIRWIREAVNSLLPVAQLGGNLVGIRMLMQRGLPGPLAGAGTTLDLTIETATQLLFVLAGFAVLAVIDNRAGRKFVEPLLAKLRARFAFSDVDTTLAARTREALFRELENEPAAIGMDHFPGLEFQRILTGSGRRWITV